MKVFSTKIYTAEEAFFESIKRLTTDPDTIKYAISAFINYANIRSKNHYDDDDVYMQKWLDENLIIKDFRQVSEKQADTFELDSAVYYIDTANYNTADN